MFNLVCHKKNAISQTSMPPMPVRGYATCHEILSPMDLSNALSYAMLPKPLQVPSLPSARYATRPNIMLPWVSYSCTCCPSISSYRYHHPWSVAAPLIRKRVSASSSRSSMQFIHRLVPLEPQHSPFSSTAISGQSSPIPVTKKSLSD